MATVKLPVLSKPKTQSLNYNLKNINHLAENKNDEEIILEAIEVGYLLYPSREFIWKLFENQKDFDPNKTNKVVRQRSRYYHEDITVHDYSAILYLNLSNVPIIEIGDLSLCRNIRILNLSSNYLINIEPLCNCTNLLRLDLQNNQISQLPEQLFWSTMKTLKILFLHNNPIGRLENLGYLSKCPCLEILTLYDTPLSLKHNYRHHTVNSILTLKALDDYVVSDEEIIEEAKLDNMFSARTAGFKINLTVPPADENSYRSELHATLKLIQKVNQILSHYSPVLILQKYVRGFIARKRFKAKKQQMRKEAAIKIQKWWKGITKIYTARKVNLKAHLDIDSKTQTTERSNSSFLTDSKIEYLKKKSDPNRVNNTPSSFYKKRNILVDLNKLGKKSSIYLESLSSSSMKEYPKLGQGASDQTKANIKELVDNFSSLKVSRKLDPTRLIEISKIISVFNQKYDSEHLSKNLHNDFIDYEIKQLLKKTNMARNISNSKLDKIILAELDDLNEETFPFRLPILRSDNSIIKSKDNLIVDMVKEKYFGFSSVKQIEEESHKKMQEIKDSVLPVNKENFLTNDQRFFQKVYGNMGLGSLSAVDKAYEERNILDKKIAKQKNVERLKEYKKFSLKQVGFFKDDRIKEAKRASEVQEELLATSKVSSEQDFHKLKQSIKERKEKEQELVKKRKRDLFLAVDFSKQHLSVSKALQKHEFLTFKENKLKKNLEFVTQIQTKRERQRDVVKKYIEQRNLLRLLQSTNDRKLIENRLKEDKEIEVFNCKKRVEYLRALEFYGKSNPIVARENNPTRILNLLDNFDPTKKLNEDELSLLEKQKTFVNIEGSNNESKSPFEKNSTENDSILGVKI